MRCFKYDPIITSSDDELAEDTKPNTWLPIRVKNSQGEVRPANLPPLVDKNAPDYIPWDLWLAGKYP